MKKTFLFVLPLALMTAALVVAASGGAGQYGAAPSTQEYSQPKPYTAQDFGPWNAGVAKTHVPEVTFEKAGMGVKVRIQVDNHPMDAQKPHWIMWIRLEDAKGKKLGEKTFKATDPGPAVAVFELPNVPEKVKAFQRCNIHGIWLNEVAVELK